MDRRTFQNELTALGGTNHRGDPNLRVVKAEEEKKFACGRLIPKYFVPGGAIEIVTVKFRKRHIFTGEVTECTPDEAKDIWEACNRADITNHWLAETCKSVTVIPQSQHGWYVEQYIPPEKIKGTPEQWEASRYQMWEDKERGGEVLTDMVGPFPREGIYEGFLRCEELSDRALETIKRCYREWLEAKERRIVQPDQSEVDDIFAAAREMDAKNEAEMALRLKDSMSSIHFKTSVVNPYGKTKINGRAK